MAIRSSFRKISFAVSVFGNGLALRLKVIAAPTERCCSGKENADGFSHPQNNADAAEVNLESARWAD
jgi:hypothetical protein